MLPDLAEQDLDAFCNTVLADGRIRDRMRRELLHQPKYTISELSETDIVELVKISNEWTVSDGYQRVGQDHGVQLVHLGAIPFRIREAIKQLFREKESTSYQTPLSRETPDGRFEVWVDVNIDTDLSDAFEMFEDAYMRSVNKMVLEECIPYPTDFEEVDITDAYSVLPDTLLYDAYDFVLNDRGTQIRESVLEDCLDFFSSTDAPVLPETVKPISVPLNQVWVRKPRVRIVIAGSELVASNLV